MDGMISVRRILRGVILGGLLGTAMLMAATVGTLAGNPVIRVPAAQALTGTGR